MCSIGPHFEMVGSGSSSPACPTSPLPCVSLAVMELVSGSYEMVGRTLGLKSLLRDTVWVSSFPWIPQVARESVEDKMRRYTQRNC